MYWIEKDARLSESVLWELQSLAYQQFGPRAWGSAGVPFYLTSNPLSAKQFSELIFAYLRDNLRLGLLDLKKTLYIFDLGAGSGRLGWLLLKELIPAIQKLCPDLNLCYVMTDIIEDNLAFCRDHPLLRPYLDAGHLDFAYFQHDQNTPLFLKHRSKELIQADNPVILICTYYFDTVPQDLFRVSNSQLEEGRISLSLPKQIDIKKQVAQAIAELSAAYTYRPTAHADTYFSDPKWNRLLKQYQERIDTAPFLFPTGALATLQFFENLSKGRLLVLSGDQGVATKEQEQTAGDPKICRHSTFSIPVNYHRLTHYFRECGGEGWLTHTPDTKYVVMTALLGGREDEFWETKRAFDLHLNGFEPIDYWSITGLRPEVIEKLSLGELLLYVKLGCWDTVNFNHYFAEMRKKLPFAPIEERQLLLFAIERVWENFYCVDPSEGQFVLNLGVLLFELEHYERALFFFQQASQWLPEDPGLQKNIAACERRLLGKE